MKWIRICFFFPLTLSAFPLLGTWKPSHYHDLSISIEKDVVYGNMDTNPYIEMKIITHGQDRVELNNIQILQKPRDWYNFSKYKPYIQIFQKIQQCGRLICMFSFLEKDVVLLEPQIGEDRFQFVLCRVDESLKK